MIHPSTPMSRNALVSTSDIATATLLGSEGTRAAGNNAPVWLDDPTIAWLVVSGELDVFTVPMRRGEVDGPRAHLCSVSAGAIVFGVGYDDKRRTTMLAVGGGDATVAPIAADDAYEYLRANPARGAALIDRAVHALTEGMRDAEPRTPRLDVIVDAPEASEVLPGCALGARRDVVWVSVTRRALDVFGDARATISLASPPFPFAPGLWALADEEGGVVPIERSTSRALIEHDTIREALTAFHTFALNWAARARQREEESRGAQLRARLAADAGTSDDALTAMASVMSGTVTPSDRRRGVPLLAAMEMVGSAQGIQFRAPTQQLHVVDAYVSACTVAQTSSVGYRQVALEARWFTRDVGPLLGFLELRQMPTTASPELTGEIERVPVALLPSVSGQYEMVNPETGSRTLVTGELTRHLARFAVQFYRGLPATPVTLSDLWRFAVNGARSDVKTLLLVAVLGALLGMVMPVLSGYLFDDVIPSADAQGLVTVFVALVVASASGVLFEMTRAIATLRLHTRVTNGLQLAILDRLIRLPATFFRGYSAGDLGQRAMGIHAIGAALGGATLSTLIGSITACSAGVLLLYYSVPLALLCVGILLLNVVVSVVISRWSLRSLRAQLDAEGRLSGLMLELLHGIAKLRVAAAEPRAFARWSDGFRKQQQVTYSAGLFALNLDAFYTILELTTTIATYGMYAWLATRAVHHMTTGQFLAFSAAEGMFIGGGMAIARTAVSMLDLLPTWERGKPLLDATPEVNAFKPDPGLLSGRIEVTQLKFAYGSDGPAILHDVSLDIPSGSFVALVGPSGSGKSTLLRLLLGFETAESGSIRFDGHELSTVDVSAIRRQIGVVLQTASLTPGDILSNIVGASAHGLEDAWEAARMAGMEDDLRAMPMGMHTLVSEGGSALSGGQRQRLLIARALVSRPRLLFFDEATSALDNRTQRIVSESIEQLHATRVVVAHRLSTIRHADRIVVLEQGRIVESGSYDELMANNGLFARMARRQEA